MKVNITVNGICKITLSPENEMEKMVLNSVFQGPVEVSHHEKLQLLDKALVDSVIISPAPQVAKKEEI